MSADESRSSEAAPCGVPRAKLHAFGIHLTYRSIKQEFGRSLAKKLSDKKEIQ